MREGGTQWLDVGGIQDVLPRALEAELSIVGGGQSTCSLGLGLR